MLIVSAIYGLITTSQIIHKSFFFLLHTIGHIWIISFPPEKDDKAFE